MATNTRTQQTSRSLTHRTQSNMQSMRQLHWNSFRLIVFSSCECRQCCSMNARYSRCSVVCVDVCVRVCVHFLFSFWVRRVAVDATTFSTEQTVYECWCYFWSTDFPIQSRSIPLRFFAPVVVVRFLHIFLLAEKQLKFIALRTSKDVIYWTNAHTHIDSDWRQLLHNLIHRNIERAREWYCMVAACNWCISIEITAFLLMPFEFNSDFCCVCAWRAPRQQLNSHFWPKNNANCARHQFI